MNHTVKSEKSSAYTVDLVAVEVVKGPDQGQRVAPSSESLSIGTARDNDLVLSDKTASRYHATLCRRAEGIRLRDQGSTNGTYVDRLCIRDAIIAPGTRIRIGESLLSIEDAGSQEVTLYDENALGAILGQSQSMRRLMARIERVAATDASVLLIGESGTGKEVASRTIHDLSKRTGRPFVTVDCGALAPNLLASELFGHEKGSFTGADRRHIGALERANGGTLFLDEIGELSPDLQPTLLGALERKAFRRVGGSQDITSNMRVVAATNRDLRAELNTGGFRLDLYYRLAVVVLQIPPLRARPDDIELLVRHFAEEFAGGEDASKLLETISFSKLKTQHWPGNIRELRNFVEATLAMGEALDNPLEPKGQEASRVSAKESFHRFLPLAYRDARSSLLREFERAYVTHWLEQTQGNVAKSRERSAHGSLYPI